MRPKASKQVHLQKKQDMVINSLLKEKNVLAMLPTNFETYIHSGEAEFHQLPPCQDSLNKHCRRANYQAAIWRNSLRNNDVPSPVGNGWSPVTREKLVIDWMK